MDIDGRINQANGRLKSARLKVAIERRGGTLSLRATLPAKEEGCKPHRQKIALGVKATPAGLQFAERRARELANDLDAEWFNWSNWLQDDYDSESGMSCSSWVEKFEQEYWNRRDRNQQTQTTWNTDYRVILNKLPADEVLSPELLLNLINSESCKSKIC
ncbi:MAG: hypothetical protein HC881_03680 [Leptolyngbyaceae cyanobacterium SL_7_1]|nr:hypothetical protein [Leptolyngbyaceae cyanobacterium SL_7_1]